MKELLRHTIKEQEELEERFDKRLQKNFHTYEKHSRC